MQEKKVVLSSKARSRDHRFFQTTIWLVTALNYIEAGRLKGPNKKFAPLPTSLGKRQRSKFSYIKLSDV